MFIFDVIVGLKFITSPMKAEFLFENNYVTATYLNESHTLLCIVKTSYIPMADFQVTFNKMEALVKDRPITTMIFDKSKLTTFHQPSMEWYHVHWKEKMYDRGLKMYRKILPPNEFFVQSVQVGRQNIRKNNPNFDFDKYDIRYFDTLEAALSS
jgi:hypothetical protein